MIMCRLRQTWQTSALLPDFRFIRTLQAPDHIVFDKKLSRYRISSQAFRPSSSDNGLSGDVEQILWTDGLSPLALYPSVSRSIGAASLTIGDIQAQNLTVHHEPVCLNWYHGAVRGIRTGDGKRLSRLAIEIVPIDQEQAARREAELAATAFAI